jgi:hypothetical protein
VTQPVGARGTMRSAVAVVAALAALLVFAPFASATSDPVAGGTTTITLNKGLFKKLKKTGIKVLKVSPGTVKSRKVTLPVASGSMDPTNGLGSLELSGGFKFKFGKKQAPLNTLVLETATSSLTGKVAGKKMKIASLAGLTFVRNGFGVNVSLARMKLTGKAAKQLNKKLGFTGKKSGGKGKSNKRAGASKAVQPPFKANQNLGGSTSETQPKTVAVVATGSAQLVLDPSALKKIKNVGPEFPPASGNHPLEVKLAPIDPTKVVSLSPLTAAFPISGGTIGPTATTGILQTSGGLQLTQNLEAFGPNGKGETTLKMGNIWVDLGAKTATVEVTIENPKTPEANLGNLGRSSIADINLTGATITSDPNARTVSVQNASATLQVVTAETLNSVFINPVEKEAGPQEKFAAGDPLGTFSFTAQTQ